ncbi:TetR/AcrR family transcriptional regulator [Aliikangiella coralliicola]|uniref:TetR/AcrR family transcriptional regulator n=1 Tax=Aliikangiella coralliicola TaxID=2592383 RepID=UPI00143DBF18|nr:TetR/AcrR family transcriptional regulator [Aliikangiella coralliicola]
MATTKRKPGRPSLSETQKQEIRSNIIEIARELFVNEGYESTSMRKIAAQAGFAPTKIYYYFENKKAILRHFWDDISEDLWNFCKPSEEVLARAPLDIIRYLMNRNVRYWLENPKSYQLGIATQDHKVDNSENFDVYASHGTRQYIDLMHHSVERCINEGVFRINDMLIVSQIIGLSVYGIYGAFYSLPTVDWQNREKLIENAIENTLLGLQK